MAEINKYFNLSYTSTVPTNLGDRYYSQDMIRDFLYNINYSGRTIKDLIGSFPVFLSGGAVTQGTGDTLNITPAIGYVYKSFTIPDTFAALPPSTTTADVIRRIETTQQTNMAIASATLNGSAINYVKIQYAEANVNSRTRAKSSGTYYYELTPSFTFTVDTTSPTNYDLVIATVVGSTGGTFTISNYANKYLMSQIPTGVSADYTGITPPSGWLGCDGSALLRASYPELFSAMCPITSGVTVNISTPAAAVFTLNGHGLQNYQCVSLETTGALPTGANPSTNYYAHRIDTNTFNLSTSIANVKATNYLVTSGAQSGTHSLRYSSYGVTGATTFSLPDSRGIHSVGVGTQGTATGWSGTLSNHIGIQGYYNEDEFQNHAQKLKFKNSQGNIPLSIDNYFSSAPYGAANLGHASTDSDNTTTIGTAIDDGVHGVPRSGYITSPARLGFTKIIKYI